MVAIGALPLGFNYLIKKQQLQHQTGLLFLVCTIVILLQTIAGKIVYLGDMWLGFLYVSIFVAALHVGNCILKEDLLFFANSFSIAMVQAGLINFGACAHQKLDLERLEIWVVTAPEISRAVGNLSQSNHTATFFVLGLLSAGWLFAAKKIPLRTLLPLFLLFQLGLVWTGSKTALVMGMWYFLMAFVYAKKKAISKRMQCAAGLAFVVMWFVGIGWSELRAILLLPQDAETLMLRVSSSETASIRIIYWSSMLEALMKSPITGYGFLQIGAAQWVTASNYPSTESFINSAHMLPIDLAIWFGVPVAAWLFTALCSSVLGALKRCNDDFMFYVITVICAIFTHAMLEAPHLYLYFLLPAGLFLGILRNDKNNVSTYVVTKCEYWRGLIEKTTIFLFLSVGLFVVYEYMSFEQRWERLRFIEAGFVVEEEAHNQRSELFLTNLHALYDALSSSEPFSASSLTLNELRNIAVRYPLTANLRRYATALAYAGQYGEASSVISRMKKMHSKKVCELNKAWWDQKGAVEYPFLKNVEFSCNELE